jgi:hypothetical protein
MLKKFTNKVFHRPKLLGIEDRSRRYHALASLDVSSASKAPVPRSTVSLNDTANQAADRRLRSEDIPSEQSALVKAGSVAWKGLETALRLLEKSAGAFPPLKSALSGLVACLDLTQVNYCFGFNIVFEVDLRQSSRIVKSMKT